MLNYSLSMEKENSSNQSNLFSNNEYSDLLIELPETSEWSFQENINNEFSSLGLYLSAHPLDSYSNILPKINIKKSTEILKEPEKFSKKNIKLCGIIFKILKRQSSRGRWASLQINDLNGSLEINIYSDVLEKYEDYLKEKYIILIDADIKIENNQSSRIIAKRITLLDEYISSNRYNLTLFTKNNSHLNKLVHY